MGTLITIQFLTISLVQETYTHELAQAHAADRRFTMKNINEGRFQRETYAKEMAALRAVRLKIVSPKLRVNWITIY